MPVEVCFPEHEVARIVWVLWSAGELAEQHGHLSSLALFEELHRSVRQRYDERGRE